MPDYSGVSKDRDIYGELGWIPNFNVKCSKNNHKRHPMSREYFDGPMNYHVTFNNSTMTNSEFFRQNAPAKSVARERVQTMSVQNRSKYGSTMRSTQSTFQTSLYARPFILDRDISNRWKCHDKVQKTQQFTNSIPFLREPDSEWKQITTTPGRNNSLDGANQTYTAGFGAASNGGSQSMNPIMNRRRLRQVRKENGWDCYIKPISKYNQEVHSSMKISFERI